MKISASLEDCLAAVNLQRAIDALRTDKAPWSRRVDNAHLRHEPQLHPGSVGYRPGRSVQGALSGAGAQPEQNLYVPHLKKHEISRPAARQLPPAG